MEDELKSLQENGTWTLVDCFGTRETIGVRNAHAITKEFLP